MAFWRKQEVLLVCFLLVLLFVFEFLSKFLDFYLFMVKAYTHYFWCLNCPTEFAEEASYRCSCFPLTWLTFKTLMLTVTERVPQKYFVCSLPHSRNQPFLWGALMPLCEEWDLESKIWCLLPAAGGSPLTGLQTRYSSEQKHPHKLIPFFPTQISCQRVFST